MAAPQVVRDPDEVFTTLTQTRHQGLKWGLVPTMGALHEGHLSLVEAAHRACDRVAVTIFVNPTQFGPSEDLDRYPRTWDADVAALTAHSVDLIFAPTNEAMYPRGCTTRVQPSEVARELEGTCRPGHFQGVATIVLKLFQIVPADQAFFGEKDFQQCLVVRDMVRDLNLPIRLTFCPTVREADGLAMSSRNRYLNPLDRTRALGLSRALSSVESLVATGQQNVHQLEAAARDVLQQAGVDRIDYATLRDAETLHHHAELQRPSVFLIAAQVGSTRLIDNRRLLPRTLPTSHSRKS